MDNASVKLTKIECPNNLQESTKHSNIPEEIEMDPSKDIKKGYTPVVMISRLDEDKLLYYSSRQWITVDIVQLDAKHIS